MILLSYSDEDFKIPSSDSQAVISLVFAVQDVIVEHLNLKSSTCLDY